MQNCKKLICVILVMICAYTGFAQTKTTSKTTPAQKTQSQPPAAKPANVTSVSVQIIPANSALHFGRYELYVGVPSMYIGHFILMSNGKYKVAFDTAEDDYDETGLYRFDENTHTIEWISGMFRNNNWGGKFEKTEKGFHIQFNKTAFADGK